jgi:membrane-bound ClpP family serine protease
MPFAVAVLCHPAGAYGCVVTALGAFVYACHTRTFVPTFTAVAAALLSTLAFLQVPPDATGLLLLALGVAALQLEFLAPTCGAALLTGLTLGVSGSWRLLDAVPAAVAPLPPALRIAVAVAGTLVLLAAVVRGFRLRTLLPR